MVGLIRWETRGKIAARISEMLVNIFLFVWSGVFTSHDILHWSGSTSRIGRSSLVQHEGVRVKSVERPSQFS